jgi:TonB family protein
LKKYYEVEKLNLLNKQKKENELKNNKRKIAFQHEKAVYERKLREFAKAKNQAILDFKRIYRREQNIYEKNIFEKNWAIEFIKIGRPPRLDLLLPEKVKGNTASETVKGETDTYEAPVDPDAKGPEPVEPPKPAEDEIFTAVEQQAEFPGGPRAFGAFLQKNLRYPSAAQRANVGGKVYVQFVVNTDGTIQDVQILKSVGFGCDEEAMRVIKAVPRWTPGKQSGRAVRSRFTQPITFVLSE